MRSLVGGLFGVALAGVQGTLTEVKVIEELIPLPPQLLLDFRFQLFLYLCFLELLLDEGLDWARVDLDLRLSAVDLVQFLRRFWLFLQVECLIVLRRLLRVSLHRLAVFHSLYRLEVALLVEGRHRLLHQLGEYAPVVLISLVVASIVIFTRALFRLGVGFGLVHGSDLVALFHRRQAQFFDHLVPLSFHLCFLFLLFLLD